MYEGSAVNKRTPPVQRGIQHVPYHSILKAFHFPSVIQFYQLQRNIEKSDTANHLYVLGLKLDKLSCTRKEFFDALLAENIQPQVHYIPVYYFPYYQGLGYKKGLCSVAESVYQRILSLPLYPLLKDSDVSDVIAAVKKVVEYYRK